jgi:hypothetical protein
MDDPFTKSIPDIAEDEMDLEDVQRSKKFLKMQEMASEYFALIKKQYQLSQKVYNSQLDYKIKKIKLRLDELELEFNSDPVFVALMKAERKTELQ